MPIYSYRCDACGFAKDVLQKMLDAPLVECPACKVPAMKKQVTSAGFQLKGSGWYQTDFRNSGAAPAKGPQASGASAGEQAGESAGDKAPGDAGGKAPGDAGGKSDEKPANKPDSDKPKSPATPPGAGSGSGSNSGSASPPAAAKAA